MILATLLRYQFWGLFVFSALGGIYFLCVDHLPDSYFSISSASLKLNFLSYYLSTALIFIGHFSGPWAVASFVLFTPLYILRFGRRHRWLDLFFLPFLIL